MHPWPQGSPAAVHTGGLICGPNRRLGTIFPGLRSQGWRCGADGRGTGVQAGAQRGSPAGCLAEDHYALPHLEENRDQHKIMTLPQKGSEQPSWVLVPSDLGHFQKPLSGVSPFYSCPKGLGEGILSQAALGTRAALCDR